MEEEYIDVHHTARSYDMALARFKNDPSISEHNKQLVLSFLRDAVPGKTVLHKAKKKIGHARLINYIKHLQPVIAFLKANLDEISQLDMERFVEARKLTRFAHGPRGSSGHRSRKSGAKKLSPGYKVDIKITIKKFYKWLWGKNSVYPEIVAWIDTFAPQPAISALTEFEMERMVDRATSICQRALIQVFFDGGFRLSEILNVRLKHVMLRKIDPNDTSKTCFFLRVPFSKTLSRTVALPMHSSTKWLKLWLEDHPARPRIREDGMLGRLQTWAFNYSPCLRQRLV